VDSRGVEGLGEGHRREDGGESAGSHRLPHPRWAEEEDVMVRTPASASRPSRPSGRAKSLRALVRGHACDPPNVQAHRSTSVAWKREVGETLRPRARTVFRLMTGSIFMGCSTTKSVGLPPQ
jgi:hypothetical protein